MVLNTNVLPRSERQCRPIAKLPLKQQREIWLTSIEKAGGKVPSGKIVKEVVNQTLGEPEMKPEPKSERIVRSPGMETEYSIYSDPKTYQLLEAYRQKIGAATKNGAIRRLLDEEKQRDGSV